MRKVKNTPITGLLVLMLITFTGCEEMMDQFGFNIDSDYYTFEIKVLPTPAGEKIFSEEAFPDDIDSLIGVAGNGGSLKSAYIKEAFVEIVDTTGVQNFNAFKSLMSRVNNGGVMDTIAWKNNIPDGMRIIHFDFTDDDMVQYLENNVYTFEVGGVLEEAVEDTIIIKGKVKYEIMLGM